MPIAVSAIGVIVAVIGGIFGSGPALVLGIMIAVVGYLSWITQDVIYRMYVTVPDGEREVFTTKDEEFAQRVAALVREAVAARATTEAATHPAAEATPPVQEGL